MAYLRIRKLFENLGRARMNDAAQSYFDDPDAECDEFGDIWANDEWVQDEAKDGFATFMEGGGHG